jgi:hypothetical protein
VTPLFAHSQDFFCRRSKVFAIGRYGTGDRGVDDTRAFSCCGCKRTGIG